MSDKVMKMNCEVLFPLGGIGGLREVLDCPHFANMNKTAEKPTPFGKAENDVADTFDQSVRDALAFFKAKHGASLKMNKLDVNSLCTFVSVLSTKKANGKRTSTLQDWHQDCKPDTIALMKKHKNVGMVAFIPMSQEGVHLMLEHKMMVFQCSLIWDLG